MWRCNKWDGKTINDCLSVASIPLTPRCWAPPKVPLDTFLPSWGTRKLHYRAHKSPPPVPILSHTHRISSENHFNATFASTPRFS
jgi:hypothetical protein